jgi:hypothetical protein
MSTSKTGKHGHAKVSSRSENPRTPGPGDQSLGHAQGAEGEQAVSRGARCDR